MSTLPTDEFTFTIKLTGFRTKKTYEGTFTYKIPDLGKEAKIEKDYARLTEGLNLSKDIDNLYYMLSYLANTLASDNFPSWWKDFLELEIRDYNIYSELHTKCLELEEKWQKDVWGEDEEPKEADTAS